MKRVLYIAPQPFFEVRGTPIATKDMLTILSSDFEIDLITYPFGEDFTIKNVTHKRSFSLGFKSVKIGPSFKKILLDIPLFFSSLKAILFHKYDYIHAVEEAGFFGVILKKISGTPLVYDMDSIMSEQIKNGKYSKLFFIFKWIEKIIIKNADLVLGISHHFESYCKTIRKDCNFVEIFDVPQIEEVALPEEIKKLFNSDKKKVMYIGNSEKYQGIDLLIQTAKLLPEIDFFIVGTGKDEQKDNIKYIPKIKMKYVWGIMQLADVLVSPRLEGTNTPMKVYTYMASGKPIVATRIPAHNTLNDCGILVDQNIDSLKKGITDALTEFGKKIANGAKQEIILKYNFGVLKKKTLYGYRTL